MKSNQRQSGNKRGTRNLQPSTIEFESLEARQMFSAGVQAALPMALAPTGITQSASAVLAPVSASADFTIQSDWGSGYQGQINVTNRGTAAINNWTLEFDFASSITQIWNGQIASHQGNHYVIKNLGWNANIAPGSAVAFGFIGGPGKLAVQPSNYLLNGATLQTPQPSLSISDMSLAEGNGGTTLMMFPVKLSSASTQAITVGYATSAGTATTGSDYATASGTLSFAPGETQKTITVAILADTISEPTEAFAVSLSGVTNATLAKAAGTGTILDDDTATAMPSLSIADARVNEGNTGTMPMIFTVQLSAAATNLVTVSYATQDGTATAGSDYASALGTLTFAPGETQKTITVNVTGDVTPELDETFNVLLSSPVGAALAATKGVGTIVNDDAAAVAATTTYHVDNSWGSGFVASMSIANTGTSNITGWTLEFDFNYDLTNIWNAQIVSHTGNH